MVTGFDSVKRSARHTSATPRCAESAAPGGSCSAGRRVRTCARARFPWPLSIMACPLG